MGGWSMDPRHHLGRFSCLLLGHRDLPIELALGKIVPERIEATKCQRCGRIFVPTEQFRHPAK
jgi:hypothetical protein